MASGSNVTLDEPKPTVNEHLHYPNTEDEEITVLAPPGEGKGREIQTDKLYVGNLSSAVTLVEVHKAFKRFGEITDIQLPYNTGPGGKPKGYAFVWFSKKEDAAKAQVKMDGVMFAKRMIKVDFAHQDTKAMSGVKPRRHPKDHSQVTTLSMLKDSQSGRNTNEQIARAEAKLRELSRLDSADGGLPAHHPSLPQKPPPTLPASQMPQKHRLMQQGSVGSLPALPLAPIPKPPTSTARVSPFSRPSATPPPLSRSPVGFSTAGSSYAKKSTKLSGVKIVKKQRPVVEGEKS